MPDPFQQKLFVSDFCLVFIGNILKKTTSLIYNKEFKNFSII